MCVSSPGYGYLALYDERINGLEPGEGFKEERLQVIVATFDALHAKSRAFWQE